MDLVNVHPIFNLYNSDWPIYTNHQQLPPAKFVEGGLAQESIVGAGCIISGGTVRGSVIAPNVTIKQGAYVEGSVVMEGAVIGEGAVVRRAILDKNVVVAPGAHIGVDADADRERFHISPSGVVVLGKAERAEH
jgi:glucose-1-phosphate adenylyltransferase